MKYLSLLLVFLLSFSVNSQEYFPKNDGVKQSFKNFTAITNASIYVSATQRIEKATLLIKENKIIEVGTNVSIPKGATVVDASGKIIYPSFIELYCEFGISKPTPRPNGNFTPQYDTNREGYYWNDHIKPEYNAFENLNYDSKSAGSLREVGFGTVLSHHNDGVIAGTGLLWTLNDFGTNADRIVKDKVSQHFTFSRSKFTKQSYPSSMMGSMALIRQVYHDAKWYGQGKATNKDLSLEAFNANKSLLQIFNAGDKLNDLRADKLGDEFGVKYLIKGGGNEFERINEIKKTGATYIIPLNFPDAYDVSDPYLAQQVSLSDMKFWNQAPFNLKILAENNVSFVLTSSDLKDTKSFLSNLRKAVLYGLPKDKALLALTETPAKLVNQFDKVGSISKGKLANFIIVSGDIFEDKSNILENWVQGNRNIIDKINPTDIRGTYDLTFDNQKFELKIEGETSKFEAKAIKDSINFGTNIQFNDPWVNLVIKNQDTTKANFVRLSGTFVKDMMQGKAVLENGNETSWTATKRTAEVKEDKKKEDKKEEPKVPSMYSVTFPNISFGNDEKLKQETILFKNVTVWTGEKEGILKETDVLIQNGKIAKIGKNLPSSGAKVVDGTGKHLTAGIIDEHSHIAISNGVNEGGQNSSAEVTIEDVVNSEDINIYRNLAGGVTSANLLHGSANPIGGRAAFIKLKWGYSPEEMLVTDAPKYIKFALGENVKQSNWGDFSRNRFPQSRMGVEQVYEDYFTRAIEYKNEWDAYKSGKGKNKVMPRFDVEMEVLGEILAKKRFITCHSYVQSEINMLMKLAERYGFKIQTFTHILEGYKLADKMSAHGVAGSTFADWWAYKYEVNDAIPYNAKLMADQGIVVAINSDDAEMGRRLNQEAAKSVKYGGMSEVEAWKMVTLNPAKLLHLDDRMGSIKNGKDADLVLWDGNPLSTTAKVELTMIDGSIYFERKKDEILQRRNDMEKGRIISKMLKSNESGEQSKPYIKKVKRHFHCNTLGEEGTDEENLL
jgi:imidazolonepropionase-like amidohydrolase